MAFSSDTALMNGKELSRSPSKTIALISGTFLTFLCGVVNSFVILGYVRSLDAKTSSCVGFTQDRIHRHGLFRLWSKNPDMRPIEEIDEIQNGHGLKGLVWRHLKNEMAFALIRCGSRVENMSGR